MFYDRPKIGHKERMTSMKKLLISAAFLAGSLMATAPALAATSFQSDQGAWTSLNPGYTEDRLYGSDFAVTSDVTLDDGTALHFTGPVQIATVPGGGWATWCCGYTDQVLSTMGASSLTIDTLPDVISFGFYAEPNTFADFLITLMMTDGSSLTQTVAGQGGAKFFGFTGAGVSTMTVSTTDGSGFALGDFFVRAVPESSTWAMMLLGFAGMGMAMRRSRRSQSLAQVA